MINSTTAEFCNLDSKCYQARINFMKQEVAPYIKSTKDIDNGLICEFGGSPELLETLNELVSMERQCCPSLTWEIKHVDSDIHLSVTGAESGVLRNALSITDVNQNPSKYKRVTKAGGLAFLISAIVCCTIPAALVLLFGIGVGSSFLFLESPLWIVVIAIALVVPTWLYLGRKKSGYGNCRNCGDTQR